MSDTLFMITGGGTGAKVAEALVHLCAAGAAPRQVHILLIDADTTNGNLQRAVRTVEAYRAMQKWPWAVETTTSSGFMGMKKSSHSFSLFGSTIYLSQITQPLETTSEGGIRAQAQNDDMRLVLDLLYDREEQTATADDGFRARPNLGCLVLADHLDSKLEEHAKPFIDALIGAASGGKRVPIVVSASIFGGTGASLLPVARGAVEAALRNRDQEPVSKALKWGAVMVLPHYQPTHRKASVDPERYLLDTSNALQFYGMAEMASGDFYDAVYAIGSDNPSRNRVKPSLGQMAQANPAYIEEMIAAAAAVDFARLRPGQPVHVYAPNTGLDILRWADIPLGEGRLGEGFGYLLHLAAFFLRPGDNHHPALSRGLAGILKGSDDSSLEQYPWYKHILDPWAEAVSKVYGETPPGRRASTLKDKAKMGDYAMEALLQSATEFFGRTLLWSAAALRDGQRGVLRLLTFLSGEDYVRLQGEMAKIRSEDVNAPAPGQERYEPEADNALARLLRTALAAEVNAHERSREKGIVAGEFNLLEDGDGRVGLRITPQLVVDALRDAGLSSIADEYTRTAVDPALAA